MTIQILGTGCPKCRQLEAAAKEAVALSGADAEVVKVSEIDEIMEMGVMMTPALAIDGEVKLAGRLETAEKIAALIGEAL